MKNALSSSCAGVLDSLAPYCCEICGMPSGRSLRLCSPCEGELALNDNGCRRCALPGSAGSAINDCGICLRQPPSYVRAIVPRFFAPPVDRLIHAIKFKGDISLGPVLAQLMATAVRDYLEREPTPDALIPMPLHWRRQLVRGFNQAELLAGELCRRPELQAWPLRVDRRLCKRRRSTAPQQGLNRRSRLHNLDRAFACTRTLAGGHLAIVDDVMTTGTSVSKLAQTLYQAGAERIDVWCCARTPVADALAPGNAPAVKPISLRVQ